MNQDKNKLSSRTSAAEPLQKVKVAKPRLPKPKLRKAEIKDFDGVYPLLMKINSHRLNKEDWYRLFQNHWNVSHFSPGIVLEVGNNIVGYLGTIFSQQIVRGKPQLFCNLTTWIVNDEYRSYSIMMLISLLRNKNLVLTSYSSNDVTYEVYKKLGFVDGNDRKRMVYPFPSFRSKNYQLIVDPDEIRVNLTSAEDMLLNDHCKFNNIYVLVKYKNEHCLLMGVKRKKKLKIYFASNTDFLQKHLSVFRARLISLYRVKKLQLDENLLADVRIFLSRSVKRGNPYQFKNVSDNCSSPLPLYTELFLLNM